MSSSRPINQSKVENVLSSQVNIETTLSGINYISFNYIFKFNNNLSLVYGIANKHSNPNTSFSDQYFIMILT